MWWGEEATKAAKIAVWWDMEDCPIPEGYDARWVRPSLEAAFKNIGYSGPVFITAYGDQTKSSGQIEILRGLSSTGVAVAHTRSNSKCADMYSDMVEWRGQNPPPATMMIISNQVRSVFSWDLARLQQRTPYNFFQAYSIKSQLLPLLSTSKQWLWGKLLVETRGSAPLVQDHKCSEKTGELSAILYCKSCSFDTQSPQNFRKHLSSYKHTRKEAVEPRPKELRLVTETWGRNYPATPEFATAKISVWWDMFDCPIPEGYDARRVRPSLEAAFKKLGYTGPVSITAFGYLNDIHDHLLRGLSSTGVNVAHIINDYTDTRMYDAMLNWRNSNPPPATIMIITDHLDPISTCLATLQQRLKYRIFHAYSCRPRKMSALLTSAEWLWEILLEESETRRHLLHKCSESESDRGESTATFSCEMCVNFSDAPCFKSLDDFRTHLSSEEHVGEEKRIAELIEFNWKEKTLSQSAQYDREHWAELAKSKRMKKVSRTGFRLLDNHLRLTTHRGARRRARKSQTCK